MAEIVPCVAILGHEPQDSKKNAAFLWLDPPLPNTYYKETMWKFHMDLEEANNNKAFAMEVFKLSEEAKNNKEVQLDILNLLKMFTKRAFAMEADNNKAFAMEVLKLSEEAKNNKEVQLDILNLLKVELLMMVMLLVVVIVMGFMVHNVMVKAM
ncbi:unnamed protein product [Lactuca saligna]|uniref:Uncharacterized protein n=1 Tax=Lactuca saligna TaxID=75948 RepID=A0AA35V8D6_LACSI|nr:unnamed protein product [Lactuca saligna]